MSFHLAISYEAVKDTPILKEVATETGTVIKESFNSREFLNVFIHRLQNNLDDIKFVRSTPIFMLIALCACGLMWAYTITSKKKLINRKEYGTSEWAKKKDIESLFASNILKKELEKLNGQKLPSDEKEKRKKALEERYSNADMILTQTERVSIYNYELNNNTLVIGGAGSGKTRGYVMPNILQAHSSLVITDPKGEILEKSGHFLQNVMNYKVRVLNLQDKNLSDRYNPFHYIFMDRPDWQERVLSLIETIIINTDGDNAGMSSDPFWPKAERQFLQSLFYFVAQGFPPEERNLNTVLKLIGMLEIKEDNDNCDSDLDLFAQAFEEKYGSDNIAVIQYKLFRSKAKGKTAASIVMSAVARLAPFQIDAVQRIFDDDDMLLDRLGEEKIAIFIVVPPTDSTYNFIAGMVLTQMFQELEYCATVIHKDTQKLPYPVRFILDEAANTCKIPNLTKIVAYARSFGIGVTLILQSYGQLKVLDKDKWDIILDQCDTFLYLGKCKYPETLKFISELLGQGTFDKQSLSISRGKSSSTSKNEDRLGRSLLDPAEVQRLKSNKCILFVSGRQPFYSTKYNYPSHANYKYTSDYDKSLSYSYVPVKLRERPHGEDKPELPKAKPQPIQVPIQELKAEFGEDTIQTFINLKFSKLGFDNDDEITVYEGDVDEIEELAELIEKEKAEKAIFHNIVTQALVIDTSPANVADSMLKLLAEPNKIGFDEHEGEDDEIYEEVDIDTDDFINEMNDTYQELILFAQQLDQFDTSAMLDIEKEENIVVFN